MQSDKKNYSKPILTRTLSIHTLQAQRILARIFKKLVTHLYAIDVILPATNKTDTSMVLEQKTHAILKTFQASIDEEIFSIKETLTNQVPTDKIDYSHIKHFDAKISSPSISLLADIICSIDLLIMFMDRLWLTALLSSQQRVILINRLEARTVKMMREIEIIVSQASHINHS
ncbi:hypothetical protein [Thorsellia anophelis]|nr:hypothetical protein [Thorsellia anophelis]